MRSITHTMKGAMSPGLNYFLYFKQTTITLFEPIIPIANFHPFLFDEI
jgi:hypothetical protein